MISSLTDFQSPFFIGIAGTGMSALAQYLQGTGMQVSGSDRNFQTGVPNDTQTKLQAEGIQCFPQDGSGITNATDLIVVSTAIEDTVAEVVKAKAMNIPIIKRSELLALIAAGKKTIAVGGTSGKSTTVAMIYEILCHANYAPGIISGAGLTRLIKEGKIGNAAVGNGEWLVIEADESDGSIVQYHPEIGVLLNIDKDHQELDQLINLFQIFKKNTRSFFVVNQSHKIAQQLTSQPEWNFSSDATDDAAYHATDYSQNGFASTFLINNIPFALTSPGKHNMENAAAAATVATLIGIPLEQSAKALSEYEGIYRRHQVLGQKNGVWVVDDYAHNPAKCAAAIAACQPVASKVVAWFQPHGYGPTKFLKQDFIDEFTKVLRLQDEIWMSEIYYAGGTAVKDISAKDLTDAIAAKGGRAYFVENKKDLPEAIHGHLTEGTVLLLMGARDPGLEAFTRFVWESL
ncbi:MAG: UDP-N-acetylmuramate--alanine ligase [Bacteroidetes bacterium]|nr:UDP-N-acetylmuramate--alanine ligase [Bacteroidota bacterium]